MQFDKEREYVGTYKLLDEFVYRYEYCTYISVGC